MAGQFNPLQMLAQPQRRRPHPNDMAELYGLQGEFGDEAEMRSIMAEKAGDAPNQINALSRLAGSWRNKQAGTMQNMMPNPAELEHIGAIKEGFGGSDLNPDPIIARNLFKRNMEQEKMRQPLEQTRMQEAGATQRAGMQAGTERYKSDASYDESVDTETIRQRPNNMYAETQRMLALNPDGTPRGNVDSAGKGTVNFTNPVNPTSANNQMTIIRGRLAKKGLPAYVNRSNGSQEQAEFNSMVANTIAGASIDPEAKEDIAALMERPESVNMSIEQLIQSLPIDHSQLDDNLRAQITDLFMKLKG